MARADIVGLAKQTAAGTQNVVPSVYLPVSSADTDTNAELLTIDETIGNRFALAPDPGSRFYEVGISGAVHPNSFSRLLSAFMGPSAMTTPGGGSISRQHVFDPVATPTVIWHTATVARTDPTPDIVDSYWDCLGGDMSISVAPNEYMLYDSTMVARKLDDNEATPTATVDATPKMPFSSVTVNIAIGGAGEAAVSCESVNLTLNNNIDTDFVVLGSAEVYSLAQGNADITGSFVVREALNTHYRNSLLTTQTPYKIRILATSATMIEGAIPYVVEFTVEEAHLEPASAPVSASDVLKGVEISFTGAYKASSSKALTARIVNGVTAAL